MPEVDFKLTPDISIIKGEENTKIKEILIIIITGAIWLVAKLKTCGDKK